MSGPVCIHWSVCILGSVLHAIASRLPREHVALHVAVGPVCIDMSISVGMDRCKDMRMDMFCTCTYFGLGCKAIFVSIQMAKHESRHMSGTISSRYMFQSIFARMFMHKAIHMTIHMSMRMSAHKTCVYTRMHTRPYICSYKCPDSFLFIHMSIHMFMSRHVDV